MLTKGFNPNILRFTIEIGTSPNRFETNDLRLLAAIKQTSGEYTYQYTVVSTPKELYMSEDQAILT